MWVDGGAVRGEGGSSHPQLVLPLTIEMSTAPDDAMMATVWVRGRLSTESIAHRLVTQPVSERLVDGFPARSLPAGTMDHRSGSDGTRPRDLRRDSAQMPGLGRPSEVRRVRQRLLLARTRT